MNPHVLVETPIIGIIFDTLILVAITLIGLIFRNLVNTLEDLKKSHSELNKALTLLTQEIAKDYITKSEILVIIKEAKEDNIKEHDSIWAAVNRLNERLYK